MSTRIPPTSGASGTLSSSSNPSPPESPEAQTKTKKFSPDEARPDHAKGSAAPPRTPPYHSPTAAPESASSTTDAVARFIAEHPRLLIVDDDQGTRKILGKTAQKLGFSQQNIVIFENADAAFEAISAAATEGNPFHVVFSDRDMGNETDGDALAKNILDEGYPLHFIMISGSLPEALPPGVNYGILKGGSLKSALERAFQEHLATLSSARPQHAAT